MIRESSRRWFLTLVMLAAIPAAAFCAIGFQPLASTGLLARGQVVGRDFAHVWAAARLAAEGKGEEIYRPAAFQAAIDAMFGHKLGLATFPYPPAALPLIGWIATLPYTAALAVWSVAGVAALSAAAWPARRSAWYFASLLLSPAVFLCLEGGQTGLLTGALMLGSLRLLDRRPALAGALLGLAVVKPHLMLLFPVALVAAGRWRALAAAAATGVALALASLVLLGFDAWRLWITSEAPYQSGIYAHATGGWVAFTTSPFGFALSLTTLPIAVVTQLGVSLAAAAAVWIRFERLASAPTGPADWMLLLAASLAASPYSFGYDAAGLAAVMLLALSRPAQEPLTPARRLGVVLLWSCPIGGIFLSVLVHSAIGGIVSLGGLLVVAGFALIACPERIDREAAPTRT